MRTVYMFWGVAALGAFACQGDPPKLPPLGRVMPDLPLPPEARVVSRSGSVDALKITFASSLAPETMATFYRETLSQGVWRLVGDTKTADGSVALYAERDGPPLWVTIRKTTGAPGSTVELAGVVTTESKRGTSSVAGEPPR